MRLVLGVKVPTETVHVLLLGWRKVVNGVGHCCRKKSGYVVRVQVSIGMVLLWSDDCRLLRKAKREEKGGWGKRRLKI